MQLSSIQKDLEKKVKRLSMEMFGWEMDKPVIISSRMKKTLGQYRWKINEDTKRPELVKFQFALKLFSGIYKDKDIGDIIKHELIHWYTDVTEGIPCHHNNIWKANCRRFGVPDNRLANLKSMNNEEDYRWRYICSNPNCGAVFKRYRRIRENYVCGKCKSKLMEYFLKQSR